MIRNYLKIAFRNLKNSKVYSFINVFGLAAGLATCLLIVLYILSELGYDRQFTDADQIYRVVNSPTNSVSGAEKDWAASSAPVAWALKEDLPEVVESARLLKFPIFDRMLLKNKADASRQFFETNGYYVDSTFFRLFDYPFIYGNRSTSLNVPNSIVLSDELALRLFGNENPVGRQVELGLPFGNFSYTVSGVFRASRLKSHIPANFFLSMRNNDVGTWVTQQTNWATNNIFHTYIKLRPGADAASVNKKLKSFIERRGGEDMRNLGVGKTLYLQHLPDIYLHSNLAGEIAVNGNIQYLYILGSIALLILLLACINFMNLSTARSSRRAREVGVRKVMGAERRMLVVQFLAESVMMSLMALALALVLVSLLLPAFNQVTGKQLHLGDEPRLSWFMAALTLGSGILAGLYPALYLSAFRPVAVLKGKLSHHFGATTLRKTLVVFQFTISIALVSAAIIIARQLNYIQHRSLGFQKEEQLIIPLQNQEAIAQYDALRNELLKLPSINKVTSGSTYPGITNVEDMLYYAEGKSVKNVVDVRLATVNDDYLETLGIQVLYGRGFTSESTGDSNSIILNETAVRELGYDPQTAVGRKVYFDFKDVHGSLNIVGVVRDFNFQSLHNPVRAFGFTTSTGNKFSYVIASVKSNDYAGLLKQVGSVWDRLNKGIPFAYSFLDQDFERNYQKDQRAARIVGYFMLIAIIIACLGLLGLSAYAAEQRTREVGIRKVLGASAGNLVLLLSREFIGLVVLAILLAVPLAWFGMSRWMENFAYRIPMRPWLFLLAGILALSVALLTVGLQAAKTAMANPVDSLRSE